MVLQPMGLSFDEPTQPQTEPSELLPWVPLDEGSMKKTKGNIDRVLRGGSWFFYARLCRSTYQNRFGSGHPYSCLGFRLIRKVKEVK